MRRRLAVLSLIAVLAMAGCAPDEEPASAPTPIPTETVLDDPKLITSVGEGIDYVLAQPAGSMVSDDIMNTALKLRPLVEDEFSTAALGDIPTRFLKITLDGLDYEADEPAPQLQSELTDIAKQLREIG